MDTVDLSRFASLFEIGFALHFAVAFIDRIYAKELPVRIGQIAARAKSLETLQREIAAGTDGDESLTLRFGFRSVANPIWPKHNDYVLDRVYALMQESNGQMRALKRILNVITVLSVCVVLYSVTVLFLIGLDVELVKQLDPIRASTVVLMQLLPLPFASAIFYFVARSMSHEVDRKIRGFGELQLVLAKPDATSGNVYISVEQVYQRDRERNRLNEDP